MNRSRDQSVSDKIDMELDGMARTAIQMHDVSKDARWKNLQLALDAARGHARSLMHKDDVRATS